MTPAEIEAAKAEAVILRRQDLEQGRREGYVGEPLFEKLATIEEAAQIIDRQLPAAGGPLAQTLRMAHDEIERLAGALLMVAIEVIVPDAFGDPVEFAKLDELRKIHASALLIAGATLIGGGDDDDTATAVNVPARE